MSILQLNNVSVDFAVSKRPALSNLDYEIKQGDFVILLGSNGSGKTTLLKLLHREYPASKGEIIFLDKSISQHSPQFFSEAVSVLTQDCTASVFNSLTLYENYLLSKRPKTKKRTKREERRFLANYLEKYNPNLKLKLDTPISHFSGGEKQAFALALRLLLPPKLLLLDEHTSALDPKTSHHIMRLTHDVVREHNITCVLTTHDLEIALEFGNRILLLRDGTIHKQFDNEAKYQLTRNGLISHYH